MIHLMYVSARRDFFGREPVLGSLAEHLAAVVERRTGRMIALRGRRQVGKSTVVERFVEDSRTHYVFATGVYGAGKRQQLENATLSIRESRHPLVDADDLTLSTPESWREWLGRIAIAARSGPVIVVLDEFPWLAAADPTMEGELQVQWDRALEKLPILLILVGSDVAMMERLSSHGRPLFGRLQQLVVPALNPAEVAQALPGRSALEVFDAYLVTGGYPRLVTDLARRRSQSAQDYVRVSLADPYCPLVTTARLSLDAEFPDAPIAYQVLSAIGANDTARPGFKDVLSVIADPVERKNAETATTRSLRTLTDTKRLVEREMPAWAPPTSRLRRYRVTDPYLRFWFRYIERQVDRISRGRSDLAIGNFDRDWSSWRGRSIEPVVREAMQRLAISDQLLQGVESVQPWWVRDGSVEVDVAAMTPTVTALIGTIKWRAKGEVTPAELGRLKQDRELVPRSEAALLAAICPSGAAAEGFDVAYSAADLLAAWR